MPKVSIIVPVYNVEKYIRRCLDSLVNQTLQDVEIVVVNDATPDDSMKIVKEYLQKGNSIRIVENKDNSGLMYTRYAGFSVATGDFIMFCDSDDYLPLDAVEVLYSEAIKNGSDVIVGRLAELIDGEVREHNVPKFDISSNESYAEALGTHIIEHSLCGKLYKRNLFYSNDYIILKNFSQSEDFLLSYQLARNVVRWKSITNIVYYYVYNRQSLTKQRINPNKIVNVLKAHKILFNTWSDNLLISELLHKNLVLKATRLCSKGISTKELNNLANDMDMTEVVSMPLIIKYYSFKEALYLLYRCYIVSYLKRMAYFIGSSR